jgi:D-alanyl-D-alanine dipeptidase
MIKRGNILTYTDLLKIKDGENKEPLVSLKKFVPEIKCVYQKKDMVGLIGKDMLVRQSLALRLRKAGEQLKKISKYYSLKVVYGYRLPSIQKKYFFDMKKSLAKKYSKLNNRSLLILTHSFVASPDVAGHIVGGAIDITIEFQGREIDMGTKIAEYSDPEKIKTFSQKISQRQLSNRLLLHDLMIKNGLAAFYGEWWHFSYGDKEWACFYGKKKSLYSRILYL